MTHQHDQAASCCSPSCGCGPTPLTGLTSLSRRAFIATTTAVAGAALSKALATPYAGPFDFPQPDEFPIPADKKFTPEWLASLTARGEPMTFRYRRGATDAETLDELKYIGMPVAGICTGQLYLGGDGKLWHWDIFNQPAEPNWRDTNGPHYARPLEQNSPMENGFAIRIGGPDAVPRRLDRSSFREVIFKGTYPIGEVTYRDHGAPVEVTLEAFSPFIPLDEDDSGIPVTILNYTVRNTTNAPLDVEIAGWLQNPVCLWSMKDRAAPEGFRKNEAETTDAYSVLTCSVNPLPPKAPNPNVRPPILFEDFEKPTYAESMGGWTATGTAFGDGPLEAAKRPAYMGVLNVQGERAVNTHVTSSGEDVVKADTHVGTLTSREFTIERRFISMLLGGGRHPNKECVNVIIDGAVVRTETGTNSNRMRIVNFDVSEFEGKKARLQIVDDVTGPWGQVWVDDIVFCDEPREPEFVLEEQPDYGTICLAALGESRAIQSIPTGDHIENAAFGGDDPAGRERDRARPVGSVVRSFKLEPGESKTATFIVAWHFPTPWRDSLAYLTDVKKLRRYYARRFENARAVLDYTVKNLDRLTAATRLWRDTWYDSTLPTWFLDRTFATACTPATSTCYRFDTPRGPRFYGWEGTYCCPGTCTHVWNYAQTLARIFPALERNVRELVDFDMEFDKATGLIHYRGEAARTLAIDGQCGTILRAYREHTMCPDDAFLRKAWPNIKKAIEFVIARDVNQDGILDGPQYNTLDTTWYGQISWISSMYLAVLRAGAAMAREMSDKAFADTCEQLAARGYENLTEKLFNGEYFIHITDPGKPEANSTGNGCHADMLFGQFYAHQLDLPRIVPLDKSRSALRSLYTYNVAPDIGPYRQYSEKMVKGGRWYAMPGEGGLLVCTWPKGGAEAATGKSGDAWAAMYFNECWTGFEHHVAAHMITEGLVQEGLVIERLIHDRHHAAKRNPYNEVECSSHYARAMSAYGAYIAMCGYAHHGSSGFLAFDPRLSPDDFRAAFTCATGWGSFSQKRAGRTQAASIEAKWGSVRVASLRLGVPAGAAIEGFSAEMGGAPVGIADAARTAESITLRFERPVEIRAGSKLDVSLAW